MAFNGKFKILGVIGGIAALLIALLTFIFAYGINPLNASIQKLDESKVEKETDYREQDTLKEWLRRVEEKLDRVIERRSP